jgi:hypothetical protein
LSATQEEELARLYRMSNPNPGGFADSPRRANDKKCAEPGGKNTKLHLCAASAVERHSTLVVHELKREGKTHKQLLYARKLGANQTIDRPTQNFNQRWKAPESKEHEHSDLYSGSV